MPNHEWSVLITDWLLAAACLWYWFRVRKITAVYQKRPKNIENSFAIYAAAAFIGGARHGLGPALHPWAEAGIWYLTYLLIMTASAFLSIGLIRALVRDDHDRKEYCRITWLALVAVSAIFLYSGQMHWVFSIGAGTLIATLAAAVSTWRHWYFRALGTYRWLLGAAVMTSVAAIFQCGWLIGSEGTLHNDVFHILQISAMYGFYRAALSLRESA